MRKRAYDSGQADASVSPLQNPRQLLMADELDWLREQVPAFDWNLKGDPQGITARELFDHSATPFPSLDALLLSLREHRQWFHLTDEEGHQLDPPELSSTDETWVSQRQTPWAS